MITKELTEQLRSEGRRLKEVQEQFLETYRQLCIQCGGPEWWKKNVETCFHHVRREAIPVLEETGMEPRAVQALFAWAEKLLMKP